MSEVIDVETAPADNQMAVAKVASGSLSTIRPMALNEVAKRLEFCRSVMREQMKEGQDYGKIPGTGDKPSLLQPGAQKLLLAFQLREQVKKEVMRDLPHMTVTGHREYEFTVTVFPAGSRIEDGWDGVGTCSTLESKYRYRKATRKCPECGAEAIIAGKEEFGGGFICWKKKNGCGAKFHDEHPGIISQSVDDVENEDPADCWNTCRKMAFKRALVAAAINATNTSELWSQDLEDMAENKGKQTAKDSKNAPGRSAEQKPSTDKGKAAKASPGAPTKASEPVKSTTSAAIFADDDTRRRMIVQFQDARQLLTEYFVVLGYLLPNEQLEDLPLQYVPVTKRQFETLQVRLADFGNGDQAQRAFAPNATPDPKPSERKGQERKSAESNPPPQKDQSPKASAVMDKVKRNPEWFFEVICPIPHKGQKRDDYLKDPDTIGSLYADMKAGDQEAQKRLWGFAKHWTPSERQGTNGKVWPITEEETLFREALDAFCEFEEKHKNDTNVEEQQREFIQEEEDDVPF